MLDNTILFNLNNILLNLILFIVECVSLANNLRFEQPTCLFKKSAFLFEPIV